MRTMLTRLYEDDYEALVALSDAERLPRAEIIRRLIRAAFLHSTAVGCDREKNETE